VSVQFLPSYQNIQNQDDKEADNTDICILPAYNYKKYSSKRNISVLCALF